MYVLLYKYGILTLFRNFTVLMKNTIERQGNTKREKRANPVYFKPVIDSEHTIVYKWLVDEGFTNGYIGIMLGINRSHVGKAFRHPERITMHQFMVLTLLLKRTKTPAEILSALCNKSKPVKEHELNKGIYNSIQLPETNEQVYRADFEKK